MILGLDVGGTHTDAVLLNKGGLIHSVKVPTDEINLYKTIDSALDLVLDQCTGESLEKIVLSTTLTTNAVAQNKLMPVGLIVLSGPGIDPECFRTGDAYYPVSGAIDHRGRQTQPVNEKQILSCKTKFIDAGIRHIGVVGKFSTRNPSHELKVKELLGDGFETIVLGHQVSSLLNFPRRIATVHLNAAVVFSHRTFFTAVKTSITKKGLRAPIHILKADGGTLSIDASMAFPERTILSGPAASVMGAVPYASEVEDTLVLDIGGTTTDIAVLAKKAPILEPSGIHKGIFSSLIRTLKTHSIAIGGDSHVRVKNHCLLIGPERKSAALAFGGTDCTPTDALVFLNRMEAPYPDKAQDGITGIAHELGISPNAAAVIILSETCKIIIAEALGLIKEINSKPVYTVHEFLDRYQIAPTSILLLGGPALPLANDIQTLSGIRTKAVPNPGVANAIGAALARTTCDVTVISDTQMRQVIAPEENYTASISHGYTEDDLIQTGYDLLLKKAAKLGAVQEEMDIEVIEFSTFNIVRGFSTQGKIMRSRLQLKPGLIPGYETVFSGSENSV